MTKTLKLSDQEQIDEHIKKLDNQVSQTVEFIRKTILDVDSEVAERIKWNNPSFYYKGEMKAFDPKEYKREIAVFNLFKNRIMLVFPSGAKLNDTSSFLEGSYPDGRRIANFQDLEDAKSKEKILRSLISEWLKFVEK